MSGKITKRELSESLIQLIKDNMLSAGGSAGISIYTNVITIKERTNKVPIGIPDFNKNNDGIMVFESGHYIEEGFQYSIDTESNIIKSDGYWEIGTRLSIIILKNAKANKIISKSSLILNANNNIITINNDDYNKNTDILLAFGDELYIERDIDYTVTDDGKHIISSTQTWSKGTIFNFIVLKNYLKTNGVMKGTQKIVSPTQSIEINVPDFNMYKDILIVFQNSLHIDNELDYTISEDSTKIIKIGDPWQNPTELNFIVIKNILENSNKVFEASYDLTSESNSVNIPIPKFDATCDKLFIFQDGTYIKQDIDYTISEDNRTIQTVDGLNWENGTRFNFILVNNLKKDDTIIEGRTILQQPDIRGAINIPQYNKQSDILIVFKDSIYIDSTDYMITEDGKYIIKLNQKINWVKDTVLDFIVLKNALKADIVDTNTVFVNNDTDTVTIGIENYNRVSDTLIVFCNTLFLNNDKYTISDDSLTITGVESFNNCKISFIVIRDSVEGAHKQNQVIKYGNIGRDNLSYALNVELNNILNRIKALEEAIKNR